MDNCWLFVRYGFSVTTATQMYTTFFDFAPNLASIFWKYPEFGTSEFMHGFLCNPTLGALISTFLWRCYSYHSNR